MNILYCGDEGIKYGVAVSILSILMNGSKKHTKNPGELNSPNNRGEKKHVASSENYTFFIATINYENVKPFKSSTIQVLDALAKKYNPKNSVKLIDASEIFAKNLPKKNMGSYFTPCSMLRLYMDKFPELKSEDRVLYLDYDVVCRGDFSEFYNTNLENIEAAGVLDIYGKYFYHYHGLFNFDYMNSGVMLFNLPECRKNQMFERSVNLCAKKWMMLADQAALNKAIRSRKLMPRKFNEQAERPKKDTVFHHFSNNFKFWPFFHVQKVKPHDIDRVHKVLKITEYDDIYREYAKIRDKL